MTKKELKEEMLEEQKKDLMKLQLSEEYLTERINKFKELPRKNLLVEVKNGIKERKKLIQFFKK